MECLFLCVCVFVCLFTCLLVCLFFFVPDLLVGNLDDKFVTRCSVGFLGYCLLISLSLVSVRRPQSFSCGGQRRGRKGASL